MSKDNMSLYSAVANSYAALPLSALHELKSVLEFEIKHRLEGFTINGVSSLKQLQGKLTDVEAKQTVSSGQNNVVIGNFNRSNKV